MQLRLTQTVKVLLIINFVMFLIQQTGDRFFGSDIQGLLALTPAKMVLEYQVWQVFTYAFLHGDVMHLLFNLLMLAFIGSELEGIWGRNGFLKFFFFCSISAGVVYLLFQALVLRGNGIYIPMVGASGGIYGLLVAYGILFSERTLLFMMLFPMKAKHFVWILAGISFLTTIYSPHGGVASVAHLGGMFAGFFYLIIQAKYRAHTRSFSARKFKKRRKQASQHLKLIINNVNDFEDPEEDRESDPKTWH